MYVGTFGSDPNPNFKAVYADKLAERTPANVRKWRSEAFFRRRREEQKLRAGRNVRTGALPW